MKMTTTDEPKQRQLLQQAEKILLHPIHPHLVTYCPTMDLIALVTDEENLDVYRINGQRAFGLKRKSEELSVYALQWEFNGKSIAVGWSDGSTDLVSAETGKVTHRDVKLPCLLEQGDAMEEDAAPRVKCMGWGINFINVDAVKKRTGMKAKKTNGASTTLTDDFGNPTTEDWDAFKDDTTLEDFLQRQPDFQALDIAPDLPDQLAMMDMEALLPKLAAIPLPPALPFMRASALDAGAFSTQAEVDALLHSHHLKDHNSVDMFIRCSDRGTVHPSIYDSLETVSVQLPRAWNMESMPLLHTSHPYSCTHNLLMRITSPASPRKQKITLVPLTLNFIPSAGIYLHLIASKTAQLQNLLLYITQTLQRIRSFFKQSTDLPGKFMMNISETLEEKAQGDLVTNLFHIACTGNTSPTMHEWLVDELAEQGHKRWDSTVSGALEKVLALLHENLLPALDRCSIVVSRLRGLAQFHDRDWIFSSPMQDFSALLEVLKNMRLLAHTTLLYASEEKKQFHAFAKWLRFIIDFEATEPESASRAEMEQREPGVDMSHVLEYIKHGLMKSDLEPYLRPEAQLNTRARGAEPASYEDTKRAVELLKEGGGFKEEALCLEHVAGHLRMGVQGLLRQVSRWLEEGVQMDGGFVLAEGERSEEEKEVDMRMVFEPKSNSISTYIALMSPFKPGQLSIHRITPTSNTTTSLSKDTHTHAISTLDFSRPSTKTTILDAKFADDRTIFILLQSSPSKAPKDKSDISNVLISLPYTLPSSTTTSAQQIIQYTTLPSPSLLPSAPAPTPPNTTQVPRAMVDKHTRHVFERRFTPLKLVVNGRKGRRVVVVVGSDRKHYRVLDMDYRTGGEEVVEGDEEGDVEMVGSMDES
ncbi:predicted protein [Plenodomus lingam JN3]|uniref:Anaphase-promoting complex subunit 4 n=1 Tax=Leptosphaeria maculans (strain JN3 / isolate v23.1.3 / race Av1-4-5-6-7-8) TaxID=985895 RepID=E4ZS31_LEPMJ|nr:predicted protein [Plenodomus lingam JN3]CBX94211.1 predicted protein [Plenodomus lingam JN3]